MDPLETQLRHCTRSWKAFVGAGVTSAVLFLAIASTSIDAIRKEKPEEPVISYVYVPPPPVEVKLKNAPPLSSSLAESFKFDPTQAAPPPEIPLDALDIRLNPDIDPGVAVSLDMQRTFEVQKPEDLHQMIIFESDQVDEIPVWLYGPMPRVPSSLSHTDCDVLVLYSISEKGTTDNIFILDSTEPELGVPVKEAVADWRFRPARKDGKPVKIWVQQPVTFRPQSKSPFSI